MSIIAATYSAVLGLRKRTWVSGMTVRKNEVVKSPADNEDYERITATGSGTTDPANDVTNYVARSYVRTTSITAPLAEIDGVAPKGATSSIIGIRSIGVRTIALSITGRGSLEFLTAQKAAGGSMRTEIIADGITVLNQDGSYSNTKSRIYIGAVGYDGASAVGVAIRQTNGLSFRRTLEVYLTPGMAASGADCGVFYVARGEA